ncbi:alanine racemase [Luteolibacter sp. AS25]|uniref:alanine racemase n=1 Tax=Luteolibacter sp. AS25 TaxID=3135776 RepID=UPI00398A873A
MPISPPRSWVEINLENLKKNLSYAAEKSGCEIMAVVKAGAYGHGLERIAEVMQQQGVAFLGVANIGEARRIREAGVDIPIYLLGATWEKEREEIVARNITPCISTLSEAESFNQLAETRGVKLSVHIAVDTGMGRGGFLPDQLAENIIRLRELESLLIEGISSHLSSSDEDEDFTYRQIASFEDSITQLGGAEKFKWRHLFNSGGIIGYKKGTCNLARPGLMVYGVSPFPEFQKNLHLVMSLKSRISIVRTVPAGHSLSYGHSFITTEPTRIATVGIGYGDGYPRQLSGKGAHVCIDGKKFPILGRVTMDQLIIGLPIDSNVSPGAEVELFGEHISVDEVATLADTIPWEIFTGITTRVERVYL